MFSRVNQIDELLTMSKEFDSNMENLKSLSPKYSSFFARAMHWNRIFKGILVNVRSMKVEEGADFLSPKNAETEKVFRDYIVPGGAEKEDVCHLDNVYVDKCIIEAWRKKYVELLVSTKEIEPAKVCEQMIVFKELFEIYYYSKYFKYAKVALEREYNLQNLLIKPSTRNYSEFELTHMINPYLEEMDSLDRMVFSSQFDYIAFCNYQFDIEDTNWFKQFAIKDFQDIPVKDKIMGKYVRAVVDYIRNEENMLVKKFIIYFDEI